MALVSALNRKVVPAYTRVCRFNFALDGLQGFDLNGKTVGIIGLGKIGVCAARIYQGFGCKLLAPARAGREPKAPAGIDPANIQFVPQDEVLARSDVLSLHCPLTKDTEYLVRRGGGEVTITRSFDPAFFGLAIKKRSNGTRLSCLNCRERDFNIPYLPPPPVRRRRSTRRASPR